MIAKSASGLASSEYVGRFSFVLIIAVLFSGVNMPFTKNFHAAAAAVIDKKKKTFKKRQCCRFLQCSLKTPAGTPAPTKNGKGADAFPAYTKSGNVAGFLGSVLQRDFINLTLQVFKVRMHVVLKCKLHGCVSK